MKALKLIYVFLLLCTIVIICSATSQIGALAVVKDIPVKVNPNKKDSLGLKTPAVIPFTAYAIPEAGVITISFVRNIGEVDVELINCASGEFVSDIVSSKDGGAIISFSGDIGHYRILFTTENGRDYIGEFDVE